MGLSKEAREKKDKLLSVFHTISLRNQLFIILAFIDVQLMGMLVAYLFSLQVAAQAITPPPAYFNGALNGNLFIFIGILLISWGVLLHVARHIFKFKHIFHYIMFGIITISVWYGFIILIAIATPALPILIALVLAIPLTFTVVFFMKKYPEKSSNPIAMFTSIAFGVVFGLSFSPIAMLLLLLLFAAYDFIAVFITKHMLALAKVAMAGNLPMFVSMSGVEATTKDKLTYKQKRNLTAFIELIGKSKGKKMKKVLREGKIPLLSASGLGNGDLMLPLALITSFLAVGAPFGQVLLILGGAVAGLFVCMMTLSRYKRAMPAIPFIFGGMLVPLSFFFGPLLLSSAMFVGGILMVAGCVYFVSKQKVVK